MPVDGSNAQTVGPSSLKWPNALFVDGTMLYIADGHPKEPRLIKCPLSGLD